MSAPRFEGLMHGLREIRDAARNLCGQGWSAASELDRVLQIHSAQVAATYELALQDQELKAAISMACLEWDAVYKHAIDRPYRLELQEKALVIAEKLVLRIDTLLILMQVPRQM